MGEYDRTGNGQIGEADWDLRSILCDMAKNWWIILLIACSAAMITYTVLTAVHRDQYTVKTTFAVMGRGENANAASSLSATKYTGSAPTGGSSPRPGMSAGCSTAAN